MQEKALFREEIPVPFVKWLVILLGLFAVGFGYAFLYQLFVGPIGKRPAPDWFWGMMMGIHMGLALILRGFRRLGIEITPEHIAVRFGIRYEVPWERVKAVRQVKRGLLAYGEVGWRVGRTKGGGAMAFVDFRSPRVVSSSAAGGSGNWSSPPAAPRR